MGPFVSTDRLLQRASALPNYLAAASVGLRAMDVLIDYSTVGDDYINKSAGLVRTARKIASGEIFAHLAE